MDRNAVAAFVRFVICGGGVGLLSSAALMLLTGSMSIAVANAIVTVVSTLLCNELHSRITFRKGAGSIRVHVESTGTAVIAYLFTTTAMVVLDAVAPHAGALTQQAVYLSASGLAGLGRFVVLRLVVFARKTDKTAVADKAAVAGTVAVARKAAVAVANTARPASAAVAGKVASVGSLAAVGSLAVANAARPAGRLAAVKKNGKLLPVAVGTLMSGGTHATLPAREQLVVAA
ncbi:hypothetical protein [Streptodolium elevatio]